MPPHNRISVSIAHPQVNEEFLCTLFAQMGQIKSCKIIREPGNDPYAFIEFMNHQSASTALTAMNKRIFLEKEMKVNWATSPGNQPKADTSAHHHIFVGDLSPEIDQETLREAFAPFGEISNCRIVKDPQTQVSRLFNPQFPQLTDHHVPYPASPFRNPVATRSCRS